jgi:sec-independent protein translocase protein TatC
MVPPIMAVPILITLLTGLAIGGWTYLDAKARTAVYAKTIGGIISVFPPAILVYLYYRDRIGPRVSDPSSAQHVTGVLGFTGLVSLIGARILSPPGLVTTAYHMSVLIPVGIILGIVWIFQAASRIKTIT